MRKVFAGAMLFSVIGAVILGGTLAWQNTKKIGETQTVDVGFLDWGSVYTQNSDAQLGPNGYQNQIGIGSISNSGEFNLSLLGGLIVIRNVQTIATPGSSHANCDTDNFFGSVESLVPPGDGFFAPGVTVEDAYVVKMSVADTAPNSCMGATVSYDVYVTVGTLGNSPGDGFPDGTPE
jgi:hypothetical protein